MMNINKISEFVWEIPRTNNMLVPVRVYSTKQMLEKIQQDRTLMQASNTAQLKGIVKHSIVLPDAHEGYGFCIGGVAAFDFENGIISPGGVGYDISCGVRLLRTNLNENDIKPKIKELIDLIFRNVPSGVGSEGKIRLNTNQLDEVLTTGAEWAVKNGYGWREDLEHMEDRGKMPCDASKVSKEAKQRGAPQIGTLGSGNHYLEIQRVDKIFLPEEAKVMGIEREGQITAMIHCGSRGLGHQVATDYLRVMEHAMKKYNINVPDRELACAPAQSREAQDYFNAACASVNFALANRQMILHWVRESFQKAFNKSTEELGLELIYDVSHNIVKIEEHEVDGRKVKLWVHRKGATRGFPPLHPILPEAYRKIGQPVIIGGSMGTYSYLLVGTETSKETFYSTAHGAGRLMSRSEAVRTKSGEEVRRELEKKGIIIRTGSMKGLAEEADFAYKNVTDVVETCEKAGISRIVCRFKPLGVIKG
ncbi:RNA-splicing ligase RtcB [Candidatus Micrarchaeota archaeon RBG_16_36_9]|nr:MAG: RNA-splicing ligase RtcB [Candidatus Micrarchaeota archaeon RBG_16_36_9]